ncbi:MAG: orotate phosphoribosyltransferase [Candidatus Cloacimonadota bacterium]|nr:MAG: orotate phosphoribosyltransferase [Candidatus Cloacimonadota bacterium]PIE77784.1 MAG: orotate phosphoribosyltransferase [Candidatus Delongbacteria bacterium]
MLDYKLKFIEFLLENGSLKFGEFTLKSGRLSPYFLNTGMLYSSRAISKLGDFYAEAIKENVEEFNVILGPAYKGIPLAIAAVTSLYNKFNIDCDYSFNRKEVKDHGDKGLFVGKKIDKDDKIIIVDDVITAGTAIRETLDLLSNFGSPKISSIVVSVDRMEKGKSELSAIQEIYKLTGVKVLPIVTILDIMEFLGMEGNIAKYDLPKDIISKMESYREQYGV